MPNYTPNFNLEKPLGNEYYDVEVQNRNMDVIDAELNKASSITDPMTGKRYKWGIEDGLLYVEEVV